MDDQALCHLKKERKNKRKNEIRQKLVQSGIDNRGHLAMGSGDVRSTALLAERGSSLLEERAEGGREWQKEQWSQGGRSRNRCLGDVLTSLCFRQGSDKSHQPSFKQ